MFPPPHQLEKGSPLSTLIERLQDADQATTLTRLGIDYLFQQPVSSLINIEHVPDSLTLAMDESWTEAWLRTHWRTLIEREVAQATERGDSIGDWISAELQAELRSMAMKPVRLDRRFLEEAVQQDAVRHMLQNIVEETLDRFVSTVKPGGRGGGLLGSVGRGAFGLASRAGRGLLGQIGEQLEQQLRGAAKLFVQSSTNVMLQRVVELMIHPETQRHLGTSRLALYDGFLALSNGYSAWRQLNENPSTDDVFSALPAQIAFIVSKPEFKARIREEVDTYLSNEGHRSLDALLGDDEYVDQIKANLTAQLSPLLSGFVASTPFNHWLGDGPSA